MSILLAIFNGVTDIVRRLARIEAAINQILDLLTLGVADHFQFSVTLEGKTTVGVTTMTLTDSQQATLTIAPLDKKGKPAQLDGVPVWASSDETVATVTADATGLTANLVAVTTGDCRITVTGDADLGSGVSPIVGTLDVTVTAGQATTIDITAGTPTEQ
jgi:hypothetical protein